MKIINWVLFQATNRKYNMVGEIIRTFLREKKQSINKMNDSIRKTMMDHKDGKVYNNNLQSCT